MSPVEALVLGITQGLTEFLPISSSAHLRVVPTLLGWGDPGAAYSAVIQLGSVLAVVIYFFKDLLRITKGSIKALASKNFESEEARMAAGIILGTIPICVIGLLVKKLEEAEHSPLRSLTVIAIASIVMGLLLFVAEKIGKHKRGMENIGVRDGVLVGLGQCMALIPGCSRSGSTLTVAMLTGLKRADAARFSFLLGIPAILLSGLVELHGAYKEGLGDSGMMALIIGLISAFIVSYASIAWLLKYLQQHSTWIFIIYRLLFGIGILVLLSQNMIAN